MEDSIYKKLKYQTASLYSLCHQLWPQEFRKAYESDKTDFREWLNSKTGLNFDHRMVKHEAVEAWLTIVEQLAKK